MIGRGIIKADDYINFGKLFDKLIEIGCYSIMYVPNGDVVYVTCHKSKVDEIRENFDVEKVTVRGGLAFVKIKWR